MVQIRNSDNNNPPDPIATHLAAIAAKLEAIETMKEDIAALKEGDRSRSRGSKNSDGESSWRGRQSFRPYNKIDFPNFSGRDPRGWLLKAEKYFRYYQIPDEEKVEIASMHLEGDALDLYAWLSDDHSLTFWEELVQAFTKNFGPAEFQNPDEFLCSIKQTGSVQEYRQEFTKRSSWVSNWPDHCLLGVFLNGLKDELKSDVRIHKPHTVYSAMSLALEFESKLTNHRPGKNASWTLNLKPSKPDSKPTTFTPAQTTQPKTNFQTFETEKQNRFLKGECFRCGDKYGPRHRCKTSTFKVLEANEDVEESFTTDLTELESDQEETAEISLHAILGKPHPTTMKVHGMLNSTEVLILIDGVSTHNFISDVLMNELKLATQPVNDLKITQDFHPFSLGGADLVLGVQCTVFEEPQHLPPIRSQSHSIPLLPNSTPPNVRPYRYLNSQKNEIEKQVKELMTAGFIQPSTSPFSSPVLLVRKKDNSWRMCIDYRALNKITIADKYPISNIDELLDELYSATVFSKLNLRSGYYQIRVAAPDVEKTAFRTHLGHYEFKVMPFGLTNAPFTFQAIMNDLFRPYLRCFILVFFDDILIYNQSMEQHKSHLEQTLKLLHDNHFFAKLSKCCFGQKHVVFLCHVVNSKGVSVEEEKISAIRSWPVPSTVKETEEAHKVFSDLKQTLLSTPVLRLPDFSKPFIIEYDASPDGVRAILSQQDHPLAYFSKGFSSSNRFKSAYDRGLQALVMAVQKWSHYLLGRHFLIRTDHYTLKFLLEQRITSTEQQRLLLKLMPYDFSIIHKARKENKGADALSRRPHSRELLTLIIPYCVEVANIKAGLQTDPFTSHLINELNEDPSSVTDFSFECVTCQQQKYQTLSPAGLLQPLPIPNQIWEDISMEFIVGLPSSSRFDTILVVVDRLSKYAHFLALSHPFTAKGVATVFCKEIVRLHGFPRSIISDRDVIFLSNFWQELFRLSQTKLKLSTSYHPQTDGQKEVLNRSLEAYLRCFASEQPTKWSTFLPWAEYSYNTGYHTSTGTTPFSVVYGREPPSLFPYVVGETKNAELEQ
ncbi:peroxidase 64 [Tanacetum coccineum]